MPRVHHTCGLMEQEVAIIDIANGNKVTIVDLPTQSDGEMTARRNRRQIEHAKGTPYVWIDGTGELEMYVLNVDDATIVTTLTGLATTKMISVENYAAKRTADLIAQQIMGSVSDMQAKIDNMEKKTTQSAVGSSTGTSSTTSSTVVADDDSDIDPVGIAALVIGACALIVGVANMIYMSRSSSSGGGNDGADSVDQKTLGSKQVN